jgi:hypothetical protein
MKEFSLREGATHVSPVRDPVWCHYPLYPEAETLFVGAMGNVAEVIADSAPTAYNVGSLGLAVELAGSHGPFLIDPNLTVITEGRERAEADYGVLLSGFGMRLTRILATESPFGLLEAQR